MRRLRCLANPARRARASLPAACAALALLACVGQNGTLLGGPRHARGRSDPAAIAELEEQVRTLRAALEQQATTGSDPNGEVERLRSENRRLQAEQTRLRRYLARAADLYGGEERARSAYCRRENERLRADLRQAEQAFVAVESGLRETYTRAQAVSGLAEARVEVGRAAALTPGEPAELREAQEKLEEADRQLGLGNFASSIFFSSSARRIALHLAPDAAPASPARR